MKKHVPKYYNIEKILKDGEPLYNIIITNRGNGMYNHRNTEKKEKDEK